MKTQNSKLKTQNFKKWRCVENCGACCHLEPEDRPRLEEYLTAEELKLYLSMIGEGGWCINLDRQTRKCKIYEERPRFCRVQPDIFKSMYQVELEDFNDFAISCCQQQITGVYGADSEELKRYDELVSNQ